MALMGCGHLRDLFEAMPTIADHMRSAGQTLVRPVDEGFFREGHDGVKRMKRGLPSMSVCTAATSFFSSTRPDTEPPTTMALKNRCIKFTTSVACCRTFTFLNYISYKMFHIFLRTFNAIDAFPSVYVWPSQGLAARAFVFFPE